MGIPLVSKKNYYSKGAISQSISIVEKRTLCCNIQMLMPRITSLTTVRLYEQIFLFVESAIRDEMVMAQQTDRQIVNVVGVKYL